jgi:hypothetical protein
MVIYLQTNVDGKFIMIKSVLEFWFYSLSTGNFELKLIVYLSMIICYLSNVNVIVKFITIKSFGAWFCVTGT